MENAESPLVSVVITSYNYERFLPESVQSALGQTYRNIEIIVVDDGSEDNSRNIITGFDGAITALYNDHRGQCAAINTGFASSQGEIIILLDADDYLVTDAVERHVNAFLENPSITKSQGYMLCVDGQGNRLDRRIPHRLAPSGNYGQLIAECGPWACDQAWTSGNAWARGFLEQVFPLPEDANNMVFPDGCLNPLAALYGPIATLDEPVAFYRIHGRNHGPISTEFTLTSLRMRLIRMNNNFDFVADRAARIGIRVPLEYWRKWKVSWKSNLSVYAISLMDASQSPPGFREMVLSPFRTRGKSLLEASGLSLALTCMRLLPRRYKLPAIRRLMGMRQRPDAAVTQKTHTGGAR
jgi:glycosyltransferase involved in cell wall biosynthesis